jgi:peroxiredoxin
MDTAVLIARIALSVVFGVASAAKFADLQGSRDTVEAFGAPRAVASIAGTLLPIAELGVAIALLLQATSRWGAVGALLLLIVFSAGVGVALAQGRTPDCNCFGQVSSEQISWRTIARNGVFAVVAGFAIAEAPGASLARWTSNLTAANLVAGIAVVAGSLICVALLHFVQLSRRLNRELADAITNGGPREPQVGRQAPAFELPDLEGNLTTLDGLRERGLPVVLLFATPSCGPCAALLPQFSRWSLALAESLTFAVVESMVPDPSFVAANISQDRNLSVLTEPDLQVAGEYGVSQTPTAFVIDADGRIAAAPALGAGAIEQMVRGSLDTREALAEPA